MDWTFRVSSSSVRYLPRISKNLLLLPLPQNLNTTARRQSALQWWATTPPLDTYPPPSPPFLPEMKPPRNPFWTNVNIKFHSIQPVLVKVDRTHRRCRPISRIGLRKTSIIDHNNGLFSDLRHFLSSPLWKVVTNIAWRISIFQEVFDKSTFTPGWFKRLYINAGYDLHCKPQCATRKVKVPKAPGKYHVRVSSS